MDNLTHSIVGLGIGALVDRSVAPEPDAADQRTRTRLLLTVCCLASNFPDLDLVLTKLTEPPLGYLLMHRGHTHTLVGALAELVVLLGLVWLLWPAARRLLNASGPARLATIGAAGIGLLLHIGMDGLNVYGVHPFWPFDAHWYYGDLVFIVEPVFWVAFGMPLAAMVRGRGRRWAMLALMAAIPLGATLAGFLQWGSLAGLLVLGLLLAWIERRVDERLKAERDRTALAASLAVSIAFVAVQGVALHAARAVVGADIARLDPGERLLDIALSAYPANPLCWSFVTVAADNSNYRLRRGMLSVAPGLSPVSACPASIAGSARGATDPQLAWQGDERASLADLRALDHANCHFDAWLRFARAPSVDAGVATDARWGPPGSRNFSTIAYAGLARAPCPRPVPGWGRPRADLLGGAP